MFSTFRKLTNRMTLPALILPAVLVTMASLLALISTAITSATASQPGELLFPLRQPALEFQLALTRDPDERAAIELQMGAALPDAGAAAGEVFESTDDDGDNGAAGQEVKEDRSGAGDGDDGDRGDGSTGQGAMGIAPARVVATMTKLMRAMGQRVKGAVGMNPAPGLVTMTIALAMTTQIRVATRKMTTVTVMATTRTTPVTVAVTGKTRTMTPDRVAATISYCQYQTEGSFQKQGLKTQFSGPVFVSPPLPEVQEI